MAVRRQLLPVAPVILVTLTLSGCGQKGGLYIPQDAASSPGPTAPAPAPSTAVTESTTDTATSDSTTAAPNTQE